MADLAGLMQSSIISMANYDYKNAIIEATVAGALAMTIAPKAGKYEKHHIFPKEFRKQFKDKGINVHKYTIKIDKSFHKQLHSPHGFKWNAEWYKFLNQPIRPSKYQIYRQAVKMLDEVGLQNLPRISYWIR